MNYKDRVSDPEGNYIEAGVAEGDVYLKVFVGDVDDYEVTLNVNEAKELAALILRAVDVAKEKTQ